MVNHFALTDEELISALVETIEEHTYLDETWKYNDDEEPEIIYATKRHKEYWDIRKELLERLKK
jgi:hypothetical protein